MKLVSLCAGPLGVDLAPEAGGSVARFAVDGFDLMRPMTETALALGWANESACYPLVPFAGRIANGRFVFDDRAIEIAPNWPGQRHPMHGDGWASPWTLLRNDAYSAEIVYEHNGRKGWPFRYRARQAYRLDEHSLTVRLSLENLEDHAVPGGIGVHPYFVREPDTELQCRTDHAWRTDADVLPIERIAVPAAWNFAKPRRIDDVALDNGFEGWDGTATVLWPSRRLCLTMRATEPFRDLVIYSPPGRPYFCVEPESHVPGAIGLTRLAAGGIIEGEVVFAISNT